LLLDGEERMGKEIDRERRSCHKAKRLLEVYKKTPSNQKNVMRELPPR
jgi:hypothetical protein